MTLELTLSCLVDNVHVGVDVDSVGSSKVIASGVLAGNTQSRISLPTAPAPPMGVQSIEVEFVVSILSLRCMSLPTK